MKTLYFAIIVAALAACGGAASDKLPFYGERMPVQRNENGTMVVDTIYHTIPDFRLLNQDSAVVDQNAIKGKVYIADFFFTSCPTICPKVRKNLKKVYEHFQHNPDLLILSHTIDTKFDTVGRLAWYAKKMNIDTKRWHLLTGDKEQIYALGRSYLVTAMEDKDAPGGFDHSSHLVLIDKDRHIRGMYDGLDVARVEQLIKDAEKLLAVSR